MSYDVSLTDELTDAQIPSEQADGLEDALLQALQGPIALSDDTILITEAPTGSPAEPPDITEAYECEPRPSGDGDDDGIEPEPSAVEVIHRTLQDMPTETQQAYAGYITGSSFKGRANNGTAYILTTATVGGIRHLNHVTP